MDDYLSSVSSWSYALWVLSIFRSNRHGGIVGCTFFSLAGKSRKNVMPAAVAVWVDVVALQLVV